MVLTFFETTFTFLVDFASQNGQFSYKNADFWHLNAENRHFSTNIDKNPWLLTGYYSSASNNASMQELRKLCSYSYFETSILPFLFENSMMREVWKSEEKLEKQVKEGTS